MGNPASKVGQEVQTQQEETLEGSLPSTPILTPRTRIIDFDPRSPSANIVRTPIEVILTPNNKPLSETENPSSEILDDPRSPTTDFTRTPIVIYNKPDSSYPIKLHNKNLDNVRKTITSYSPTNVKTKNAPILLESSPVIPKPTNIKRKSFAGLLETNLDFIETDLDTVINRQTKPDEEKNMLKKIEQIDLNTSMKNNCGIKQVELEASRANEAHKTEIETVKCERFTKSTPADVNIKDFNKKLANLIYEDDEAVNSPVKNIVSSSEGNRTPLGERNSNTESVKKFLPKLKVSDKPRKLDREISKIPVFKDKRIRGKLCQSQCENTPPSNMNDFTLDKPKIQQWDQNNTLII